MNTPPLVSVITVCRNAGDTIRRTVESVKSQSWRPLEYIVIDGASTDQTLDILHANRSSIDVLVSEPDGGIYDAMNKGLRRAAGEFIGIINADDWYERNAVKAVVRHMIANDLDVCFGKMAIWRESSQLRIVTGGVRKNPFASRIHAVHPTVFVRRSMYAKVGLFNQEYRIAADRDLLIRFQQHGARIGRIDTLVANFSLGGASHGYDGTESIQMLKANGAGRFDILNARIGRLRNRLKLRIKRAFSTGLGC